MTDHNPPRIDDIAEMVSILKDGGWRHATLKIGDFELTVSDGTNPTITSPTSQTPTTAPLLEQATAATSVAEDAATAIGEPVGAASVAASENVVIVRAETLGIFWRSPQPGAPAFVEPGVAVDAETPLAIVEVMKLMTRVTAGVKGTVTAIHVENGDLVEAGQALVSIATD